MITPVKYTSSTMVDKVGWVAKWLAHSTFKRDFVGLKSAWVETIFRPLVRLAHTRRALGWV